MPSSVIRPPAGQKVFPFFLCTQAYVLVKLKSVQKHPDCIDYAFCTPFSVAALTTVTYLVRRRCHGHVSARLTVGQEVFHRYAHFSRLSTPSWSPAGSSGHHNNHKRILFVCGGSGLAPVLPLVEGRRKGLEGGYGRCSMSYHAAAAGGRASRRFRNSGPAAVFAFKGWKDARCCSKR